MDATIFMFLVQDGLTNGAIYGLLGLALVLVFAVTRVILIPQGEFVAYGALTYALIEQGLLPGTVSLLMVFGAAAFVSDLWWYRRELSAGFLAGAAARDLAFPAAVAALASGVVPAEPGLLAKVLLTIAIVTPLGPYLNRIAFRPIADASVLVLLIAAVGVHLAMMGLGLVFFGAEGFRSSAFGSFNLAIGPVFLTVQNIAVYGTTLVLMAGLWLFFGYTLIGKALRATAVNRLGARLVGIRTSLSGGIAFGLAAFIGAVSGILLAPVTTVYYDTGFLIGLKGFVAAIIAGLASFPGTAAAALVVGLVESFASFFASNYKEIIVFTLIIPVLLLRSLAAHHTDED